MRLPPIIAETEAALEGWPDNAITTVLVLIGLVAILIAVLSPSRIVKATVAAWMLAP